MSETLTMGGGSVPAGSYAAEFAGASSWEGNPEYGPALQLRWRILSGDLEGQEATRIASKKLSPKSSLGKFALALKGGPIAAGEAFSFADYIGVRGLLVVESTDSGGSRVSAFIRQAN